MPLPARTDRPPNILFITSHDTGNRLGCYGHRAVDTPALDRLAAQGCRFANAFCVSPICTPTRGAMMTGRYPQANGLMGLIQTPYRWRLNASERHLSHLLAARGYHTTLVNHQHEAPHGARLGFHRQLLVGKGSYLLGLLGEKVSTAAETADALAPFFRERARRPEPFYAQVGFYETHTPYDWNGARPDGRHGVDLPRGAARDPKLRRHLAAFQGAVRSLDRAMGRILAALDAAGLAEDTLVLYTSDHGPEVPHGKWTLYEAGLRVALLLRWPSGDLAGGRAISPLASQVDLVPTLLDLARLPSPRNLQGISLAPVLRGEPGARGRDEVFAMMHQHDRWVESRCVRTRRHKLIRNFSPSRLPGTSRERPPIEFYDLDADPIESRDLGAAPAFRAARARLDATLLRWMRETGDPLLRGPMATPYFLRARKGLGHGGLPALVGG
jgi:arylsulfatase A-like enzyme